MTDQRSHAAGAGRKIQEYACLLPFTVGPEWLADFVEGTDFGFVAKSRALSVGRPGVWDRARSKPRTVPRLVEGLRNAQADAHIGFRLIADRADGEVGTPLAVFYSEMGVSGFSQLSTTSMGDVRLVDHVSGLDGVVCVLRGDALDLFTQAETDPSNLEAVVPGFDHTDLPRLPQADHEHFAKIDVSGNPGRGTAGPLMAYCAASEMWFGEPAFRFLDRDRLMGCDAVRIEVRDDGLVYVKLFDLDDPIELIRERQAAFRATMGFDEIEAISRELCAQVDRPFMLKS